MTQATVLYDAPGPKALKRSRVISIVGVLAILGLLAWVGWQLYQPRIAANGVETPGMFDPSRWDVLGDPEVWSSIGVGAWNTIRAAAVATVGALIIGVLFVFGRMADTKLIRIPVTILLEFFRGMPVLLMMLFIMLVAATSSFNAVVIALAIYNGAIIGEALRAGIVALHTGQREAGLSIGLTKTQTRLLIEFPQAFKQMLPIIIAQIVVLLKDTSLGYIVAYPELARTTKLLETFFGNRYMFTFWVVGIVIYLAINLTVSWIGRRTARVLDAKQKGDPARPTPAATNAPGPAGTPPGVMPGGGAPTI